MIKVAAAQIDVKIGQREENVNKMAEMAKKAIGEGAKIIVFPECSITGYVFDILEEVEALAHRVPDSFTVPIEEICRKHGAFVVLGTLEREGERCYNTAVLFGPEGMAGKYRKVHLPVLGADRFLRKGDLGIPVFETSMGKIGMAICYDLRFPEFTRVLALKGADIVIHIANLPPESAAYLDFIDRTRACENRVYVIGVNRVGIERGTSFIGRSQILDYSGKVVSQAGAFEEEIIYAEIDPVAAKNKKMVVKPGEYEADLFGDRRPDLYKELTRI